LAIVGGSITLALGGSVRPETIQIVDSTTSVFSSYGELESGSIIGYGDNFTGWAASPSVQTRVTSNGLVVNGSFQSFSTWSSISLVKSVDIELGAYPILDVLLNVTIGVRYGIRFFAQHSNGTEYNVWWEGSALDHRSGRGYEAIRANMERQSLLATGRQVDVLSKLQIYVEDPPNTPQNFQLVLSRLLFVNETLADEGGKNYRATYLDLRSIPHDNASWYLNRINIGVSMQGSTNLVFAIYLFDGPLLHGSTTASGIVYNPITAFSEYTFYPNIQPKVFPELLPKSNASIVFVAGSGSIQDVDVSYVNFIFLPTKENPNVSQQSIALLYVYFIFFLFLLPLGIAILVFREFFFRETVGKSTVISVLLAGVVCRLALAATTAHVFDMNVMLASTRGWVQFGTRLGSLGPTLPLTFFLYWIGYSPYSLLQVAGFQDINFLGHAAGLAEGIFVKLFPMVMDILTFFLLLRFKPGGRPFVWATFYLLNPLAIFISSVWGQYEAATMTFIVWATYCMSRQKFAYAAFAFVISGMIQLLGFLPYTLLLAMHGRAKHYASIFGLSLVPLITLAYLPQADLTLRLILSLTGYIRGQYTEPGRYSLLGNFPQLSFVSNLSPLILAGGIVLVGVFFDTYRRRMNTERIVFYTAVSSVAFLLLSNLVASWLWLLPAGLLYALLKEKNDLGAFMLVFGTSMAFLTVSNTTGSAYLLVGDVGIQIQPAVEGIRNQLKIFSVMGAALGILFLFYLRFGAGRAAQTMLRASGITLSLYLMLYFWLAVYPL
jgi:hypothetical protein